MYRSSKAWEIGATWRYDYRTCSQTKALTLTGDTINVESFAISSQGTIDYRAPSVLFKYNSLITVREKNAVPFTDLPADSTISTMIALLNDNPTIILQLNGHCDTREHNPEQLSQQRAQLVADMLTKRGVPKERLICKGFGNKKPFATNEDFAEANQSEKKVLHQINRRVTYSIPSMYYNEEGK